MSSLILAALGIATIVFWNRLFDVDAYFKRTIECLRPAQRDRLDRVLSEFRREPGKERLLAYGFGILAVLAAAALLALSASAPLTFAVVSVYFALVVFVGCRPARDPSKPRTARLARRNLWDTVPVPVALACAVVLCGVSTLIAYPQLRLAAILVASAMVAAFAVVWRIASEPSVLAGLDPLVETAVDRRVRTLRALSILVLTCLSGAMLPLFARTVVPPSEQMAVGITGTILQLSATVLVIYNAIYQTRVRPFLSAFGASAA